MVSVQADAWAQAAPAPYKAPRLAIGQPDIGGYCSNSTLTPMTRPAAVRDRLVYTEEEVKKLEGAVQIEIEEGNQPTDPDAPAEYRNPTSVNRPEFTAAGGAVGGYNRGWLDPGNLVMRVNGEPRTSIITTANGLAPPRKPQPAAPAAARGGGDSYDSYETRSLGERCIIGFGRNAGPPMFPNGFYNNNYHIVQSPDAVMIEVEMNHDARIIRLNSKHRTDNVRPYFGDAIGWWEGDTLVVETTNFNPQESLRPYFGASLFLSPDARVTERFTRTSASQILYEFSVQDPKVYTQVWRAQMALNATQGPMYEYACHEGNYALPGILGGARLAEKEGRKTEAVEISE
jgi:hypothetical protein